MGKSVEGVFRGGKIELVKPVTGVKDETKVIVSFVGPGYVDLQERGISEEKAARVRAQLASFSEEWDSPEMDIYDDYDNAKRQL